VQFCPVLLQLELRLLLLLLLLLLLRRRLSSLLIWLPQLYHCYCHC
jgi:hypothetical protein